MADKLSPEEVQQFKDALRKVKQQLDKSIVTKPAERLYARRGGSSDHGSYYWEDDNDDDSGF